MKIDVKLKAGKYLIPVKLLFEDEYIFVSFGFSKVLIAEIKSMEGARWLGYENPPRKVWRINNSPHNIFQLEYLQGKNPYKDYDKEPVKNDYQRPLYDHQKKDVDFLLLRKQAILAAEMGCLSGDTIVTILPGKKDHSKIIKLEDFYLYFHNGDSRFRHKIVEMDFRIKTLVGSRSKYVKVYNVICQGIKQVRTINLENGHSITVTPDHEIGIGFTDFAANSELMEGDLVRVEIGKDKIDFIRIESFSTWFEQEVYDIVCDEPYRHFLANNIHVHNCGKTLVGIEVMERSGFEDWWYVGPKSAIKAVEYEFNQWDARVIPEVMTYQKLVKLVKSDADPPQGLWLDESSRIKSPTAQRSQAALIMADRIREKYGKNGYIILTSGSPAPKSPLDWYNQCETACSGFIKEGSYAKFRNTLAIISQEENLFGQAYPKVVAWLDDSNKCAICGEYKDTHSSIDLDADHQFTPSVNECERLYKRMSGLVLVQFKKDCLDLPDKIYRCIELKPSKSILDIAKSLVAGANTIVAGLILLRELSDGFQYIEKESGEKQCSVCAGKGAIPNPLVGSDLPEDSQPIDINLNETVICDGCGGIGTIKTYTQIAEQFETPKDEALRELLDEYSEIGRVIIYAGFTGSIDRCVQIVKDCGWEYIRVDGRGWHSSIDGDELTNFQKELVKYPRIAFIGQPGAAGMGLTLTASPVIIYYSNDFNAESRIQSEDRAHRPGMDINRGCTIIDLLHLNTDYLILENLKKKRELQALTMGDVTKALELNRN